MNPVDTLAGALELRPGPARPNIRSTRPALVRALLQGRPAAQVPDLLGRVFALCGDAHRLMARRAIAAAQCDGAVPTLDDRRQLQLDTLREQLRRIWLDWPAVLSGHAATAQDLATLRACPVLRRDAMPDEALRATRDWLAAQALAMPAADWLQRWRADPQAWLSLWSARAETLPAQLLNGCRARATSLGDEPHALRVQANDASLRELADRLRADPGFAAAPTAGPGWHETGPWTRAADAGADRHANAWLRLGARLADAVYLALGDDAAAHHGAHWLQQGALMLTAGEGLAWCEMARGLLVHRVRLAAPRQAGPPQDCGADTEASARIAEYDIVAPTEWNFHVDGPVAQALRRLPSDAEPAQVRLLAAAFDPCVEVRVVSPAAIRREPPRA